MDHPKRRKEPVDGIPLREAVTVYGWQDMLPQIREYWDFLDGIGDSPPRLPDGGIEYDEMLAVSLLQMRLFSGDLELQNGSFVPVAEPSLIAVARDVLSANSDPQPLHEATLLYAWNWYFRVDAIDDKEQGAPRFVEVKIWRRDVWEAKLGKPSKKSFRKTDEELAHRVHWMREKAGMDRLSSWQACHNIANEIPGHGEERSRILRVNAVYKKLYPNDD